MAFSGFRRKKKRKKKDCKEDAWPLLPSPLYIALRIMAFYAFTHMFGRSHAFV